MINKKVLRNDLILIGSLLLVASISLVAVLLTRVKTSLIAKVYSQNKLVETFDLSKKEDKTLSVKGLHGYLTVQTHDGAIAITESDCPHQDCVHMGYIKESNRPIICAYNAVYVVIEGKPNYDVEI